MITINEITIPTEVEPTQKWEQPFKDLLDEIFWSGYSEQLIKDDPRSYQREYFYFMQLYDSP